MISFSHHNLDRHLLAGLSRAVDWIDNSLQNVRRDRGQPGVHRTQSLILVHIGSGIDAPADIARSMGITRQNVHHMARMLIDEGLVEQVADEDDPRRSKYRLTQTSTDTQQLALETLAALETVISRRAGVTREEFQIFQRVLSADWGDEIPDHTTLMAESGLDSTRKTS